MASARSRAALAELGGAGVPVLCATARRLRGAFGLLRENGLALPVVGLNGAVGAFADGTRFHSTAFADGDGLAALRAFLHHHLPPCVYVDEPGVDVALPPEPATHPGHVASLAGVTRTADPEATLRAQRVFQLAVLGRAHAELAAVAAELGAAGIAHDLAPEPVWLPWGLTATAPGVSKWAGVEAFGAATGASLEGVVVVGDGTNDVPMLRRAARPVCVADSRAAAAMPEAETIPPPEADGWADLLPLLGVDG